MQDVGAENIELLEKDTIEDWCWDFLSLKTMIDGGPSPLATRHPKYSVCAVGARYIKNERRHSPYQYNGTQVPVPGTRYPVPITGCKYRTVPGTSTST